MSSLASDKPLDLYGPKGFRRFLELIYKPLGYPANFRVRVKELGPGEEVDRETISSDPCWQSTIFSASHTPSPRRSDPDDSIPRRRNGWACRKVLSGANFSTGSL